MAQMSRSPSDHSRALHFPHPLPKPSSESTCYEQTNLPKHPQIDGVTLLLGEQGERIRNLGNATLRHTPYDTFGFILDSLQQTGEIETVLQIGANDGIHFDQIAQVVNSAKTRCILVEPNPEAFQRLSDNHRDTNGIILENVAVSTRGEHSIRLWTPSCSTLSFGPSDVLMSSDRALLERLLKQFGASTEA